MLESSSGGIKTRNGAVDDSGADGTGHSDWKVWDFNWDAMFNDIDSEISKTSSLDVTNGVRAFTRYFISPNSPFNIKAIYDKLCSMEKRLDKKDEEIDKKDKEIIELKKKVQNLSNTGSKTKMDLKKQSQILEVEKCRTKITLANIPLTNPSNNTETTEATEKTVADILKAVGLSPSSVKESRRMYPKQKKTPVPTVAEPLSAPPTEASTSPASAKPRLKEPKILFDFHSITELKKFTAKLKELTSMENYRLLSMENFCPEFLISDFLKAKEKDYHLRKAHKKTKIFITTKGIILKVRDSANEPLKRVDYK